MAKVLGESGRYCSQQEIKKTREIYRVTYGVMVILGAVIGYLLCLIGSIRRTSDVTSICSMLVILGVMYLTDRIGWRKLTKLEKARMEMRKGAAGENAVAQILNGFPEQFFIINGLLTAFGDLDHVVVGPTGVYILDTKDWIGTVTADGDGELLLNGRQTDKPTVKPLMSRAMNVRNQIKTLCNRDPYFNVILVFPHARVEANWRDTKNAKCIRSEQLWDHIVEDKFSKKLDRNEVKILAQGFRAIATMDKEFQNSIQ